MIEVENKKLLDVERQLCELSLANFVRIAWNHVEAGQFIPNWHIDLICKELEAVTEGTNRDLLINVPPGTAKSLITCVFWPCWVWGPRNWPQSKWFLASYSDELTIRDSVRRRNLMTTDWYQRLWGDRVKFNKDQNLKTRYSNEAGGEMMSSSVGGAGLGEHPDVIVIDDPSKTQEADSDKERENVRMWWQGTVATRGVLKGSRRVVIMQRLHEGDLSGVIIAEKRAKHICLPMFYEPNHPFKCPDDPRTKEGELLWPAAFTPERIKAITDRMPRSVQAGQLQQRPTAQGGGMFRRQWFRYYEDKGEYYELTYPTTEDRPQKVERIRKSDCWRFAIADTALTENKKNDPTAVAIVDVERKQGGKNRILFVEMLNFYAEAPEVKRVLQSLIVKHQLAFIGVEDTLDGKHIIQQFRMAGLPVRVIRTDGKDKVMRAVPLSLDMENEQVWLPANASWLQMFESQLLLFPNDIHDDMCLEGGSLVETPSGSKKIKDVVVGDSVLGSKGFRLVTNAGMTSKSAKVYRVDFSDGSHLVATGNHPIFIEEKGFIPVDCVTHGDKIRSCKTNQKSSLTTERTIEGIRSQREINFGITTTQWNENGKRTLSLSIDKCGLMQTDQFQRGIAFITKTGTRSTTRLKTLSASAKKNTFACISGKATSRLTLNTLSEFDRWPLRGTRRQRVKSGIKSTQTMGGSKTDRQLRLSAECAASLSRPKILGRLRCVATTAELGGIDESTGGSWCSNQSHARFAGPSSRQKAKGGRHALRRAALSTRPKTVVVKKISPMGLMPVYNLTVDDSHDYFANGVLVHNCDCAAHAANAARNKDFCPPVKEHGVSVQLNGKKEVIVPGTMGWVMGFQDVFGPKKESVFSLGHKKR